MRYQHNRLQQLRGFYFTAKTGSVSAAARRMYLTQPTVSLQIQALEREFALDIPEEQEDENLISEIQTVEDAVRLVEKNLAAAAA